MNEWMNESIYISINQYINISIYQYINRKYSYGRSDRRLCTSFIALAWCLLPFPLFNATAAGISTITVDVTPWSEGKANVGNIIPSMNNFEPVLSLMVFNTSKSALKNRIKSFGFLSPFKSFSSKDTAFQKNNIININLLHVQSDKNSMIIQRIPCLTAVGDVFWREMW